MELIISETLSIAVRLGIQLENINYYMEKVIKVLKATALNNNSMLQDILNFKPTEIDFLNGKISEFGKEFGILTPINTLLTSLIKTLEKY
jgi:2-dehydropantoate 2-reductase